MLKLLLVICFCLSRCNDDVECASSDAMKSAEDIQRETARVEGAEHKELLEKAGLLGLRRSTQIQAFPYKPDQVLQPNEKVVHLVRHGQGFHNYLTYVYKELGQKVDIADPNNPYNKPEVLDPPLTTTGRREAQKLQSVVADLKGIELIVVSPMRRATETGLMAFADLIKNGTPVIGHADCHEERHPNICDCRRPMSEIKQDFPMVDWSQIKDEVDPLWVTDESGRGVHESGRSVSDRGYNFLLWLEQRSENNIAVASHSAWLFTLVNSVVECSEPQMAEWWLTGELRSMVLRFSHQEESEAKRLKSV